MVEERQKNKTGAGLGGGQWFVWMSTIGLLNHSYGAYLAG